MAEILEVRPQGERWVIAKADGTIVSSYRSAQYAIEEAKALAWRTNGDVRWLDSHGKLQGQASYQLFKWRRRPWWYRLWRHAPRDLQVESPVSSPLRDRS
jgi:hypothetical protein